MDGNECLRSVLVVDDEESMREVCSEILDIAGYSVSTACNGREAMDQLDREWDLVLTDINMPELNGLDLYAEAIRKNCLLQDRFLFMTGDRKAIEAVSAINSNFIKKPFRVKELLSAVDSAINSSYDKKRTDTRLRVPGCGVLIEDGLSLKVNAVTEDISRHGMRITYMGRPLEAGAIFGVRLSAFCLNLVKQAKVIWSAEGVNRAATSGLMFTVPLQDSMIAELAVQGWYI